MAAPCIVAGVGAAATMADAASKLLQATSKIAVHACVAGRKSQHGPIRCSAAFCTAMQATSRTPEHRHRSTIRGYAAQNVQDLAHSSVQWFLGGMMNTMLVSGLPDQAFLTEATRMLRDHRCK